MKAAFLTSSLIAPKGKALPASRSATPTKLLDDESNRQTGVSRIYERVREYADPHEENESIGESEELLASPQALENEPEEDAIVLHEDESVSIAPKEDIYDFSRPKHESQSGFERIREQKQVIDVNTSEAISPLLQRHSIDEPAKDPAKALSTPKPIKPIPVEKYTEIATEVSKLTKDKLGRIRISVRMAPKDHLQLKLIAAHTQMSAQAIFETALEEYVSKHGSSILPDSCACVLDKSSL